MKKTKSSQSSSQRSNTSCTYSCTRRELLRNVAFAGSAAFLVGNFGILQFAEGGEEQSSYSMIAVDYARCTGCRTCEAVCSAYHNNLWIDGELLPGLGNPYHANIKIYGFNPDVDVPSVCVMCLDAPCIQACPVLVDTRSDTKALHRHDETGAIVVDTEECVGCRKCAEACRTERVGVIVPNPETGLPERMCTLCYGDPQCVKHCPRAALVHVKADPSLRFYGMSPQQIAGELIGQWYRAGDSFDAETY